MVDDAHTTMEVGSLTFQYIAGGVSHSTKPFQLHSCESAEAVKKLRGCHEGPLPPLSSARGMLTEGMELEWNCASKAKNAKTLCKGHRII